MVKKRILVTGSNGQLGKELQTVAFKFSEFDFIFTSKHELNIVDEKNVSDYFNQHPIDILINCAAYTAVDKAESDSENANLINCSAVKYLTNACSKQRAVLIHLSTDFVFDGNSNQPYGENDMVNPLGVYGASKLCGEIEALKYNRSMVIRTSWVYSSFGNNFVKTMLRLAKEKPELKIVNDQKGSPTYARDLAEAILWIIKNYQVKDLQKLFHFSNEGEISWFEFAKTILEVSNIKTPVVPISTAEFPTPAKRPAYSVMNKTKIQQHFNGLKLKPWNESLQSCLAIINQP